MRIFSIITGSPKNFILEHRIYNTTSFFAALVMFMTFIVNKFSNFPSYFNLTLFCFGLIFSALYYISRFKKYYQFSRGALIGFILILAPISWHFNQGITGTSTFYFYTFVLLMIASLNRSKYIFGFVFICYVILLSMAERYFPWFVVPFKDDSVEYLDFFFSFVITFTIFVIGAILLKTSYEQERNRAIVQSEEITKQRDELSLLNSEMTKHNELISQQKEELEELNSVNNKLFAIISHDLRSPLANLETLIQVMTFSDPTAEESKQLMFGIQREVANTSGLLENLLHWAKKQRNGLQINTSEFQLKVLVQENLKLVEGRAKKKMIELKDEVCPIAFVKADKDMIRLVIRNLLSNAVKFCSQGDKITFSSTSNDGMLQVEVADTGCGISQENQRKLFQTIDFTKRGTDNEKGTGLGLMLCKDFVLKNGGKIWFKSKEGEGTSFFFSLPIADTVEKFSPID